MTPNIFRMVQKKGLIENNNGYPEGIQLKALILVGGFATRLRPLSINKPKCLFPINNKPIIEYLLENLAKSEFTEVILAVNNLDNKIEKYVQQNNYDLEIKYSYEEIPLGTGGPIKLAEKQLRSDAFLVLNGDILSWIDYKDLVKQHKQNNSIATITLKQVQDPTRYGVVRFSEENTIQEFVEKPNLEEAPSNWINAGCYAFTPEIFEYIPEGKVSIERQVFPVLAEIGQLHGYKYHGDWIDIGIPEDYLRADAMIREEPNSIHSTSIVAPNPYINNTIIWEHTTIHKNTYITDTIIGANCTIHPNTTITNTIIADNTTINPNLTIRNAKIWPNLHIENNINSGEIKT